MTIISTREPGSQGLTFNPFASFYRRAATAVLAVSILCLCAIHATVFVTEPQVTRQAILSTLTRELDGLRMEASCDAAGEIANGRRNCLDVRGFRVVRGEGYRVFSMRYSRPMFVFAVDHGMEVENEHDDARKVASEGAAFIRYFAP